MTWLQTHRLLLLNLASAASALTAAFYWLASTWFSVPRVPPRRYLTDSDMITVHSNWLDIVSSAINGQGRVGRLAALFAFLSAALQACAIWTQISN
jgi:hypothetical protein